MIITSLLDTDLYKFTMMQVVFHRFPRAMAEYRFVCRTTGVDLRPLADRLRREVAALATLSLSREELNYLRGLGYFSDSFLALLSLFRLDPEQVVVGVGKNLEIRVRGPWWATILYEVPVLALVNQLHFEQAGAEPREGRRRLQAKVETVRRHADAQEFRFTDFGTRRRFSFSWQEEVVATLAATLPGQFAGTSNLHFARTLGLAPVGTMAHEFLQACQVLGPRLDLSQKFALEVWAEEYRGKLGIALSDVCGVDAFLRDFDGHLARLYDGARHDSGDPVLWGEKLLAHYAALGIPTREKKLVFSDGLTMDKALALHDRFRTRCRPMFGIGTHLTNDLGPEPLQIVIKLTAVDGRPVAKISDSPGKGLCDDPLYLAYLSQVFRTNGK